MSDPVARLNAALEGRYAIEWPFIGLNMHTNVHTPKRPPEPKARKAALFLPFLLLGRVDSNHQLPG